MVEVNTYQGISLQEARRRDTKQRTTQRTREQARNHVGTTVAGKRVYLDAPNKRPKPARCELCDRIDDRLGYHHWDDEHPSRGIWSCYRCHMAVERWEKGDREIVTKYLILKDIIDEEMTGLR